MEFTDAPAAVMPMTPRRRTVPAAVSNISDMQPLPSAPVDTPVTERTYKNTVVPLVANVSLVAEIEKVNVKLDVVIVNLTKVNDIIMQGVGDPEPVEPPPPVPAPPVPTPVDNLAQILDEMRLQQREMRKYIMNLAFVMTIVLVSAVYVIVYMHLLVQQTHTHTRIRI